MLLPDSKFHLIDEALNATFSKIEEVHHKNAETLFRQFFSKFDDEDIKSFTPISLSNTFLSLWDLLQNRQLDQVKYRIYRWKPGKYERESERLVIDLINKNMPFIVDSLIGLLQRHGLTANVLLHPVVCVKRDREDNLVEILPSVNQTSQATTYESIIHCEVKDILNREQIEALENEIPKVLQDIRSATSDWMKMRQQAFETIKDIPTTPFPMNKEYLNETIEFIKWFENGHFTFLGYCEYVFNGDPIGTASPDSALGIMKNKDFQDLTSVFAGIDTTEDGRKYLHESNILLINKSSKFSTVHRSTPMDTIGIRLIDKKGKVTGLKLFIGLFTSEAYDSSARDIPLLREKVNRIVQRAGFDRVWHDGKALIHILDSLPRDELFQANEEELTEIGLAILEVRSRQRLAMFMRKDQFNRFYSCLVYIPRDRFDYELCEQIRHILRKSLRAEVSMVKAQFGSFSLALVHYRIAIESHTNLKFNHGILEQQLIEAARSWSDTLKIVLESSFNEWDSLALFKKYGRAFSKSYEDSFDANEAYIDIQYFEKALPNKTREVYVYRPEGYDDTKLKVKIYNPEGALALSDILPTLENLDLKVLKDLPYEIKPQELEKSIWVHDFEVESRGNCSIDLKLAKANLSETFYKIWSGHTDDDAFNRLVIRAGFNWRQSVLFLAYCRYLRQIGIHFSEQYIVSILIQNPGITRMIGELFQARFDPITHSKETEERIAKAIDQALIHVDNPDDDRILRHFVNIVSSTVRTNFYQLKKDNSPKSYISFKLDCSKVEDLPLPKPMYEIFVFSPDMEAIHLRGGKVARGGIRWSDRMEDYRKETLSLMKAQMVKNTVIIPVGSKGGFIVKKSKPGASRDEQIQQAVKCYKKMMRGLLDITDNLINGKVVPPVNVIRHDEEDTYLVVAADKGTATFSDYANEVSAQYNFWLQDAFASGGSFGYDHKKMGITAKGAWESVKQHFRSMDINVDKESITAVGIGDMSGDVFGNGMLLSESLKLLAAFNHMHIFIDPDPIPEVSFKERQRLFNLSKSSWGDYDTNLLSQGGKIFNRHAKSVSLTPEIMHRFNLAQAEIAPHLLIQAILKARVDLLWFGGIGTYVKSKFENHVDVGDRINDDVRVNGADIRAKVIAEGANLGMTQLSRIEFARLGGLLNTDAIDNSAGVDCSDHEVNIKILMNHLVAEKKISFEERNRILEEMTSNVSSLVLRDNQLQNQAITNIMVRGIGTLDQKANLMRSLEKIGLLNRDLEYLPDDTTIAEYQKNSISLTRPEVAILLAYAKIKTYQDMLDSPLLDHPYFESRLISYFPDFIQQHYRQEIFKHPLKREIIATIAINTIINRMGASFVNEMIDKTSAKTDEVLCAYFIVQEIFELRDLWYRAENLHEHIGSKNQLSVTLAIWRLVRRAVLWMLRSNPEKLDLVKTTALFSKGIKELEPCLSVCLDGESLAALQNGIQSYVDLGLSHEFSQRLAQLGIMASFPDIILIAQEVEYPVKEAASVYFLVGDQFGFNYFRQAVETLKSTSSWYRLALMSMTEDLYNHQGELTIHILNHGKAVKADLTLNKGEYLVKEWIKVNLRACFKVEQMLHEVKASGSVDFAQLTVMTRELRMLSSS